MGRGYMFVNHLLFTDDIIFDEATKKGAENIRNLLTAYEQASGQLVNYEESLIYFEANVDEKMKATVKDVLKVRIASNPKNYLRLPMMVKSNKKRALSHYIDQIRKKGGKLETLIKVVLQSLPIYAMQWFLFPKTLCSKIEGLLNNF